MKNFICLLLFVTAFSSVLPAQKTGSPKPSTSTKTKKTVALAKGTEISFADLTKKYHWNGKYELITGSQFAFSREVEGGTLTGSFKIGNLRFSGEIKILASKVQIIDLTGTGVFVLSVETPEKIIALQNTKITY